MLEVVCIPTCKRPEFLALCLERLDQAAPAGLDVRIFADTAADLESVAFVRDQYFPQAEIFLARAHTAAPSGTWNILNSIKQGYQAGADLIYHVEEDVMIRPNFFQWHRSQHADKLYLATCGRKVKFFIDNFGDLYSNPGSCLSRRLVEALVPHICEEYYKDPGGYLLKHFPPWPEMSQLDDGLIRRVIRQLSGRVKSADPPVCAHQGFRTYNVLAEYKNHETKIEARISRLREILANVKPGRYTRDLEVLDV